MSVSGDCTAASGPSIDQIVSQLQGRGATQGWDVVVAQSARKVNELFQRQFVTGLAEREQLLAVSGTVPVVENIAVEFVDSATSCATRCGPRFPRTGPRSPPGPIPATCGRPR
jgi:hypothetical protein